VTFRTLGVEELTRDIFRQRRLERFEIVARQSLLRLPGQRARARSSASAFGTRASRSSALARAIFD
jgi:hypothetical protein